MSSLSDQDIDLLATLDLDLVCDFRRAEEQLSDPSRLPGVRPPRVASLPIIPGSNSRFLEEAEHHLGDRQAMFDFMVDINRDFAEGQIDTYARMFREILALEDARFLVHCAAGKDGQRAWTNQPPSGRYVPGVSFVLAPGVSGEGEARAADRTGAQERGASGPRG